MMSLYRYDDGDDPTLDLTPFQVEDTVEIDVAKMFADESECPFHTAGNSGRCNFCEG